MSFGNMTAAAFLDLLAAGEPTPGGGGAAALTGSSAAALISMVINFTVGRKKYAEVDAEMRGYLLQSEALRRELLDLADADAAAFEGVAATYKLPKETDADKTARTAAMQDALKHATAVPYATAEKCIAVARLAEPVGAKGNANVVSDAATALYLAFGAFQSALVNININLASIKDEAFLAEWNGRVQGLRTEMDTAYARAKPAIEGTLGVGL